MVEVEVFGVSGGDICNCDLVDCVPLDDDWRVCPYTPTRDRDLFGDLFMFKGATNALDRFSSSS
jgi:hypothetical protein